MDIIDFIKSLPKWGRYFTYACLILVLVCILSIIIFFTVRFITGKASIKYGNWELTSGKKSKDKTNSAIDYHIQRDISTTAHFDSQTKNVPSNENKVRSNMKTVREIKKVTIPIIYKDSTIPVKNDIHAKNVAIGNNNKVGDETYNITNTNQPRQLTKIIANKIICEIDTIRMVNNIKRVLRNNAYLSVTLEKNLISNEYKFA